MDQARWLIVVAVIICSMFTLAVLQRLYPAEEGGEGDEEGTVTEAVFDRNAYVKAKDAKYQGNDRIVIQVLPDVAFDTPAGPEAQRQASINPLRPNRD